MSVEQFPFIKNDLTEANFGMVSRSIYGMREIKGREDIIIREEDDRVKYRYGGSEKEGFKMRKEVYKKGKKLFQELESKYNINVIPFDYVIGKTDQSNNPQIFSVTKKIFGKNIEDISEDVLDEQENKRLSDEVDQLISSLTDYVKDKYVDCGDILNDVFYYHQYVFGKKSEDRKNKIYLVDIEPLYIRMGETPAYKEDVRDGVFLRVVQALQDFVTHTEHLTHKGLMSARKKIEDLFEYVLSNCLPSNAKEIAHAQTAWKKIAEYGEERDPYK